MANCPKKWNRAEIKTGLLPELQRDAEESCPDGVADVSLDRLRSISLTVKGVSLRVEVVVEP